MREILPLYRTHDWHGGCEERLSPLTLVRETISPTKRCETELGKPLGPTKTS